MMIKKITQSLCILIAMFTLGGCTEPDPAPKIGISFGVGEATRWQVEMDLMVERAKSLGLEVEARLNKTDKPKTQTQDCFELIDSGISVLILVPRDVRRTEEIINYAKSKNVKVLSYARSVLGEKIDLFVGVDIFRIGHVLGQHLVEKVYKGDVIVLGGDENDFNSKLLHLGAMQAIEPLVGEKGLRVILSTFVPKWSKDTAKDMVKKAVAANNNKIDAIFASNDKLAEGSLEALKELGITSKVIITGMDAEIPALKRIMEGTQDVTIFIDTNLLAVAAVDEANNMVTHRKVSSNSQISNEGPTKVDAYLITGKVVTKENMERVLFEGGHVSREAVLGNQ